MMRLSILAALCSLGCSSDPSMSPSISREAKVVVAAGGAKPVAPEKSNDRKIRYTANVEVVVKNLDATQEAVEALVKSKGGYVAKSELVGQVGDRRHPDASRRVHQGRTRLAGRFLAPAARLEVEVDGRTRSELLNPSREAWSSCYSRPSAKVLIPANLRG